MRVAGLDQSTNKTGFAVMEKGKLIHYECIDLTNHSDDYLERILQLEKEIAKRLKKYKVVAVCLEDTTLTTFGGKASLNNVEVLKKLTKNLGNIELYLVKKEIAFETIKAGSWRKGMGFGRKRDEQKTACVEFVNKEYKLGLKPYKKGSKNNDDDIAEAVCIARYFDKKMNK